MLYQKVKLKWKKTEGPSRNWLANSVPGIDALCGLGFANFYRRFIRNVSSVAAPLHFLEWRHWLEEAEQPFVVWTHHENLEHIKKTKRLNLIEARWLYSFPGFTLPYVMAQARKMSSLTSCFTFIHLHKILSFGAHFTCYLFREGDYNLGGWEEGEGDYTGVGNSSLDTP